MPINVLKFLILVGVNVSLVTSSRILVLFYHHGPSHFHSFYPLFNELAERGHNVTVMSYIHVNNPHKNYNELLLTEMPELNGTLTYDGMLPFNRNILTMHIEFVWELYQYSEIERENALKSTHIDRILETHRQQPFDIVLLEQFIIDFYLGLVHKLNVPFIGFSTCALPSYYYDQIGLHDLPSFVPFAFSEYSWDMNFYERTINWLTVKSFKHFFRLFQIRDNQEIRKRLGDDIPDVAEIAKNISLTFVNQHYSFSGPKPLSNRLIEVGGIHITPAKPLPEKFKRILDNAKNGVLLVSWGGNVMSSSIPLHTQQEMIKGFAKLPLQVIWKWENASMQDIVPKNVLVSSWVPQRDILCHPNLKVFWTHGGNLGTIETVHCGKPAIVTPFYGDQYLDAAALSERGMGFRLNIFDITADKIGELVDKALQPQVTATAQKVAYEHNNRLTTPLETAVWWVEHTIATGGFELGRGNTADMSWFTYHSFDVIAISLLALALIVYVLKWLVVRILKCCWASITRKPNDAIKKHN